MEHSFIEESYVDLIHKDLLKKSEQIRTYLKNQRSINGTCHEDILRNALSILLPKNYSFANGIIIYNGESSKQIDIIVYDNTISNPICLTPTIIAIEPEQVKLVIEVKASIKNNRINDAIENFHSVEKIFRLNPATSGRTLRMILLGYDTGWTLNALNEKCSEEGFKAFVLSRNGKIEKGALSSLVSEILNS